MNTEEKRTDSRIRSLARRNGYYVRKSREWKYVPHPDNYGEYMLMHPDGYPVLGFKYDADPNDIVAYFAE